MDSVIRDCALVLLGLVAIPIIYTTGASIVWIVIWLHVNYNIPPEILETKKDKIIYWSFTVILFVVACLTTTCHASFSTALRIRASYAQLEACRNQSSIKKR